MIRTLQIKNFLLIPDIEIDFSSGLTVVTGETGAGKSLIVDSIELALGARSDSAVVRSGCDKAEIFVFFGIEDQSIRQWLQDHELDDGEECIIRRVIFRDRPSRAYINGRPASVQSIRELTSNLVEIHGQHEHQRLLKTANHRDILDGFAGVARERHELAKVAAKIKQHEKLRAAAKERSAQIESELEILNHQFAELESLRPASGEFSDLKNELSRLSNAEELAQSLQEISGLLLYQDDFTVSSSLGESIRRIEKLSQYDEQLQPYAEMLTEARVRVDDAAREIYAISSRTESDPAAITAADERMALLQKQARLHQVDPDDLPQAIDMLSESIAILKAEYKDILSIDSNINDLKNLYHKISGTLSRARQRSAKEFSQAISQQIQSLGMEGGIFEVRLEQTATDAFASYGSESVSFAVSANPGQSIGALSKVASGGELSRLSLAIQVASANTTEVSTLIFDEIDIGIGGKVADRVGSMLRKLGESRQIFCVTHLPQVAARGNHQFKVEKKTEHAANVEITTLDAEERISEIARMLGGAKITDRTTAHAKELLSQRQP